MKYMQSTYNKNTEEYKEYNNAITASHLPLCNYCIITVTLDKEADVTPFILYRLCFTIHARCSATTLSNNNLKEHNYFLLSVLLLQSHQDQPIF